MAEGTRERLKSVRDGLLRLHKKLLESEQQAYERDVARIETRGQLLDLVMNDPWFAWLRDLSRFIITIDEWLDSKEPTSDEDGERLVARARTLIAPSEDGAAYGFARKYYEAMQRDPDVVLAHRDMVRAFGDK